MNLGVYFVTPDNPDLILIEAAIKGGATVVQYRDKTASEADMILKACAILRLLDATDIPLIINDRIEVAIAAGAHGLHIGQSDGCPQLARERLGANAILGVSIENRSQLNKLPANGVDYLGVGPVRATSTKSDHAPPLGIEGVAYVVQETHLPVVAIGGLTVDDIPAVKRAGCKGMAVVSAISSAGNPQQATHVLHERWHNA